MERYWRETGESYPHERRMGDSRPTNEYQRGEAVAYDPLIQKITFMAWDTQPYEGYDVEMGYTLAKLFTSLGITIEDCRAAFEKESDPFRNDVDRHVHVEWRGY